MDGEDVMEESYIMKGKSIGRRGWKKGDREECIKEERGTKSLFFVNPASSGVFV